MKNKADRQVGTVERFVDGSSLETCPDGSVLLREGRLARALPVRSEANSSSVAPARLVRYDEPPPRPPSALDGGPSLRNSVASGVSSTGGAGSTGDDPTDEEEGG